MSMEISELYAQVVQLSKYVGREQTDEKGDSMFPKLLVQERDEPLIVKYLTEAAVELDKLLRPFGTLNITATSIGWDWNNTQYDIPATIDSLVTMYLVDWVMGAWCKDKVAERSEYFMNIATKLGTGIPLTIFRKKPV